MLRSRLFFASTLLATTVVYACVDSSNELVSTSVTSGSVTSGTGATTGGDGEFNRQAMLQHLGEVVISGAAEEFLSAATALKEAAATYQTSGSATDLEAARTAWRNAMSVWQRIEVMQVGPAGKADSVLGGADLRDEIYSWPLLNRCRVDQELVAADYGDQTAFALKGVNVRGLDALEYLLFYEEDTNDCAPQNSINAMGTWAPIVAELPERRAAYAATIAAILEGHAQELADAWNGSFITPFAQAGTDTSVYPTQRDALNAVSDALFYLEKQTKDAKLGISLEVIECNSGCPPLPESGFAGHSKLQVQNNIAGFRALFTGGVGEDALGFDDWLEALGAGEVADAMLADLGSAEAALLAIEETTIEDAIANDRPSVEALHAALVELAAHLKTDFVTVLDLELPKSVEGDND